MGQVALHYLVFETANGFCGVAWNDTGISRFRLPAQSASETDSYFRRWLPGAEPGAPASEVAQVVAAATRYFAGEVVDFSGVTLDLAAQSPFCQQVYAALRRVGWGQTTTYGGLARDLGAGRKAARDVGVAMANNPMPLIIPCHRVLAAGGKVGGFSAPGGAGAKVRMLELEGVRLGRPKPVQQSLGL